MECGGPPPLGRWGEIRPAAAIPANAPAFLPSASLIPAFGRVVLAEAEATLSEAKAVLIEVEAILIEVKTVLIEIEAVLIEVKVVLIEIETILIEIKVVLIEVKTTFPDAEAAFPFGKTRWSTGKTSSLSVTAGFLTVFAKTTLGGRLAGSVPTVPGFAPSHGTVGGGIAPEPPGCHTGRTEPMSTLVCFALKEEAAPFHRVAARHPGVVTLIVGIGRANAEKAVRNFLGNTGVPPGLVLTCGFAGGLNPDLKLGDVVFEIGHRQLEIENRLRAAGAQPAKIFCADTIAITAMEKWQLAVDTGADAVEMESAAIHAVCAEKKIACVTVRVISDTAHEDLPLDFNALAKADRSIDFGKLFFAIAKSPNKIPQLMQLQKKTKFAAERLADVLGKVISA